MKHYLGYVPSQEFRREH